MSIERTLSIVKPDGVGRNLIGEVYRRFEQVGLKVVAARMMRLSQAEAEGFYAVHRERPFFKDLVRFMTSGPVMVQVLEGENAIAKNREVMGATDPRKADKGTIRADLATGSAASVLGYTDDYWFEASASSVMAVGSQFVVSSKRRSQLRLEQPSWRSLEA